MPESQPSSLSPSCGEKICREMLCFSYDVKISRLVIVSNAERNHFFCLLLAIHCWERFGCILSVFDQIVDEMHSSLRRLKDSHYKIIIVWPLSFLKYSKVVMKKKKRKKEKKTRKSLHILTPFIALQTLSDDISNIDYSKSNGPCHSA